MIRKSKPWWMRLGITTRVGWRKLAGAIPRVKEIDVVLGLTYGTDRTTNNKENQILAKLLAGGFVEEFGPPSPVYCWTPGHIRSAYTD